jgi:ribonuclease G
LKSAGRNVVAVADGEEYLLPKGAPGITEGAKLNIEVAREALGGAEPWKRPLARVTDLPPSPAPALEGREVPGGQLDEFGWQDLLDEARSGIVRFSGGELRVALTPAMTLVDVDGHLPAAELAVAGARAAAQAIRRHGIGGSIGVDLPTVEKAARQAAAAAVDAALPQPFERTAVNGFGFLQIVRPRPHASLFELSADRASFEARILLRQAAREIGAIEMVAHPSVAAILKAQPAWIEQLSRQVGGAVALRAEPSLAISAGYAKPA